MSKETPAIGNRATAITATANHLHLGSAAGVNGGEILYQQGEVKVSELGADQEIETAGIVACVAKAFACFFISSTTA